MQQGALKPRQAGQTLQNSMFYEKGPLREVVDGICNVPPHNADNYFRIPELWQNDVLLNNSYDASDGQSVGSAFFIDPVFLAFRFEKLLAIMSVRLRVSNDSKNVARGRWTAQSS